MREPTLVPCMKRSRPSCRKTRVLRKVLRTDCLLARCANATLRQRNGRSLQFQAEASDCLTCNTHELMQKDSLPVPSIRTQLVRNLLLPEHAQSRKKPCSNSLTMRRHWASSASSMPDSD